MFKVWKSASILVVLALVLSLGLVMAPLAGTAEAKTLRVPEDYRTIQSAIDDASAGDTILVGPETYYENLYIGDGRDRLTIRSTGGAEVTTIVGTGPRAPGVADNGGGPVVAICDVNGVTFQGFNVSGGTSFYGYGLWLPGCGIFISNAANCLITDNIIRDNEAGIFVLGGANNTRILGNDIINNTGGGFTGIYIESGSYGTEVHFNNIKGNSPPGSGSFGVWNYGDNPVLDATFNWWGEDDESGPYDPGDSGETEVCPCTDDPANESNEDGKGDTVSNNVDYCPWLLERFSPKTSTSATTGKGDVSYNTTDWDSAIIQKLEAKDLSQIDCPPKPEMYFPYGIFSFTVLLKNPGGTVTVTITLPENMPRGTQYWKCQNGEWVDATSLLGDDDGDNILTLTLTDGGLGDADGVANGVIVDPGGVAIPIPLSTMTGEVKKAVEPAAFSASYLRITPQQVNPNQPVEVAVNVANTGGESGSRAVILYVNDKAEQSQTVTVVPGSTQNVVFTVTRATPGTYNVLVEGQRGQFVVKSTSTFGGGGLGTGGIIAIVVVLIALIVGLIFIMRGAPGRA